MCPLRRARNRLTTRGRVRRQQRSGKAYCRDQRAQQHEPISEFRIEGLVFAVAVLHAGRYFAIFWHGSQQPARRIDHRRDAVIGGAQNPAAIFRGAHAHDQQVLLARRAVAEPAVVRDVEQHLRAAVGEPADIAREHRFVADERADAVLTEGETTTCLPGAKSPASVEIFSRSRTATARTRRTAPD